MTSVIKNDSIDNDFEQEQEQEQDTIKKRTDAEDSDIESNPDTDANDSDVNPDIDTDNSDSEFDPEDEEYSGSKKQTTSKNKDQSVTDTSEKYNNSTLNEYLQPDISSYSDVDSDVTSDDEDNYKKLDNSRTLLNDTHKNLQSINYIEVEQLSRVTRDADNRIIDENHRTVPILSKYERTRILGLRSRQINSGAPPFVNVEENIIDGYVIAERELQEKKIPFIIKRPISNDKFEYWRLEDLEIV